MIGIPFFMKLPDRCCYNLDGRSHMSVQTARVDLGRRRGAEGSGFRIGVYKRYEVWGLGIGLKPALACC